LLVVVNIGYPCFWESFLGFIANTLFIGILTSYIFYYIVVYLPEKRKKDVIKNFYKKQFKDFKTQVIIILLRNLPNIPADDQDSFKIKLTDISNFRVFFKTFPEGSPFQDRWGKSGRWASRKYS